MKLINYILICFGAIGTFFSAIFYVLFKQAKEEAKRNKEELIQKEDNLTRIQHADKVEKEERKNNESKIQIALSSDTIDAFNALNEL